MGGGVNEGEPELPPVEPDEPTYVDLGLPSGNLWATCNLGAESETDYGLYFQWGDNKGYKTACSEAESDGNGDAHCFNWSKYKYCNGSYDTMTKYCTDSEYGTIDNKTVLEPEDDAATVMLGGQWRMPTVEELQEMIDNTEPGDGADQYSWIENYNGTGVNGLLRKSKTNGNTIFFPAAGGYKNKISNDYIGIDCNYMSSSLYGYSHCMWVMHFSLYGAGVYDIIDYNNRYFGMSIRAIKPSEPTSEPIKLDAPVL